MITPAGVPSLALPWKGRADPVDRARRQALDAFFQIHEKKALRIARAVLADPDDALDAVQEAMMRLVRSYARRPEDEWAPLFYRILHNAVHDILRRRSRRRAVTLASPDAEGGEDPWESIPDPGARDPFEDCAHAEFRGRLARALARLPRRQREAFMLRVLAEADVAATARSMGCGEGSVKTHLSRALAALRRELGSDAAG